MNPKHLKQKVLTLLQFGDVKELFTDLIVYGEFLPNNKIDSIATDGIDFFYNEKFVEETDFPTIESKLYSCVISKSFLFPFRGEKKQDIQLWNLLAAYYSIKFLSEINFFGKDNKSKPILDEKIVATIDNLLDKYNLDIETSMLDTIYNKILEENRNDNSSNDESDDSEQDNNDSQEQGQSGGQGSNSQSENDEQNNDSQEQSQSNNQSNDKQQPSSEAVDKITGNQKGSVDQYLLSKKEGEDIRQNSGAEFSPTEDRMDEVEQHIQEWVRNLNSDGKDISEFKNLLEQIRLKNNPHRRWNLVLKDYFTGFKKTASSFSRPNRRFMHGGLILPSMINEPAFDKVSICIDVSGSIGQDDFNIFMREAANLIEECRPSEYQIVLLDHKIRLNETFTNIDELFNVKLPSGQGGNNFGIMVEPFNESKSDLVIYFTDLQYEVHMDVKPKFKALWLVPEEDHMSPFKSKAPFGKEIIFNKNK